MWPTVAMATTAAAGIATIAYRKKQSNS